MSEKQIRISGQVDVKTFPELGNIDQSAIKDIYDQRTDLHILVGITGSGKSSLLVGSDVFEEGDICTEHVAAKCLNVLRIWDSPCRTAR